MRLQSSLSSIRSSMSFFFLRHPPRTDLYTLSLHDALPISPAEPAASASITRATSWRSGTPGSSGVPERQLVRSEEHTSELQSRGHLVCRLLLEKKKKETKSRCSDDEAAAPQQQRGRLRSRE